MFGWPLRRQSKGVDAPAAASPVTSPPCTPETGVPQLRAAVGDLERAVAIYGDARRGRGDRARMLREAGALVTGADAALRASFGRLHPFLGVVSNSVQAMPNWPPALVERDMPDLLDGLGSVIEAIRQDIVRAEHPEIAREADAIETWLTGRGFVHTVATAFAGEGASGVRVTVGTSTIVVAVLTAPGWWEVTIDGTTSVVSNVAVAMAGADIHGLAWAAVEAEVDHDEAHALSVPGR